jgi:hypothetical protein
MNGDQAGPLGESGGPLVGKGGESDVESRHLQGCSPRLCQLRTDGLAPVIKYWTYWSHVGYMGPNKPSSFVTTWPNRIPYSTVGAWEEEWGSSDRWPDQSISGAKTSSEDVGTRFNLVGTYKMLQCMGTACRETYEWHTWTARGSIHGVLIRFSLAGCTSIRITMTLGYEYRLLVESIRRVG